MHLQPPADQGQSTPEPSPADYAGRTRAPWLPIERADAARLDYEDFLARYVHAGRPVVISNVASEWSAMRQWTPAHFKQRFGSKPVAIGYGRDMPFDKFIDEVAASSPEKPGPYMYRSFLHEVLPELLPDVIPQNKFAFPRRYASPLMPEKWRRPDGYLKLLVGGVGSKFPVMHFDGENAHAVITQVYGDKEFIVYAPEDTPNLYPKKFFHNHSLIDDPVMQDLERFPLLARATQYRTILNPGDMVFVPAKWWHVARALSTSISVCSNILDGSNWDDYVEDVAAQEAETSPRRGKLIRRYLKVTGRVLGKLEAVQHRSPALARALLLPRWLAPVSAEVAPEPSRAQLQIRIPTS
ncbi:MULTISPECIES: cupin-like domain-containing protein [unclassified Variovorax]|uniref:cupin-like domain-containing protein n=1 Tax=unclassified Variovorax TaxID=663243 RepID=UPI001BD5984F|nr:MULTISPECIES: cupin-like domain-containing protein [unclassified Variovorax]